MGYFQKVVLQCKICNCIFQKPPSLIPKSNCCSKKCYSESTAIKLNCVYCMKEFRKYKYEIKSNQKRFFCSKECYSNYGRTKLICLNCNNDFFQTYSRIKSGSKFCSQKCKIQHNNILHICKNCNKEYSVRKSRDKKSIFCSKECYSNYGRTKLICLNCNNDFLRPNSQIGYGKKNHYCSKKCMIECFIVSKKTTKERKKMSKESRRLQYITFLKCHNCGSDFTRRNCHAKQGEFQYCCQECRFSCKDYRKKQSISKMGKRNGLYGKTPHNKGIIMKAVAFCNNCNKTFFKKRCILSKPRKTNNKFCSMKCMGKFTKGVNSPRFGKSSWMKGKHHSKKSMEKSKNTKMKNGTFGKTAWNKGKTGYMSEQARINIGNARKTPKARSQVKKQRAKQKFPAKDSHTEKIMQQSLYLNNINFSKHKRLVGQPDIFIEPNYCVFVDGDYWHANPKIYKESDIIMAKTSKEVWNKDYNINLQLKILGYEVMRFWETDINKDVQVCVEEIKKWIKK